MCPATDFSAGSGGQGGASLSFPVMSAQGQIFVAGNCAAPDGGSAAFLLAVFRDGSVDWIVPAPYADAAPVVDASGNIYLVTSEGSGAQSLSSFDPSGTSRFTPVTYGGESAVELVVGASQVVDIANGSAFGLDGSAGYDVDVETGPFANAFYDSIQAKGGAVDAAGNVYFPFTGASSLEWGGLSPSGSLLWSLAFSGDDDVASCPVLAADGTLLTVETESQDNPEWRTSPQATLVALDSSTGKQLWSKASPGASSLALGPSGMVLLAGSSVQSVFAGQLQPSGTAPWSRYRGGNSNRGAAFGQ
jgi:outer membrane protein assembly factor BamB